MMLSKEIRIKAASNWLGQFVEGFMFNDVQACIDGKANFAGALALSVYSEILGGLRIGRMDEDADKYKAFLKEMGYDDNEAGHAYGQVRCGLVHQYFLKQESTIHMREQSERGLVFGQQRIDFYVTKYFEEFKKAYFKYKRELLSDKDDLLENFEKATMIETLPLSAKPTGNSYGTTTHSDA